MSSVQSIRPRAKSTTSDKVLQFVNLLQQESEERTQMFEGYDDLLTVQDLSAILRQSEQTIRRMCNCGELKAVRIGKRLYVSKSWFVCHIEGGE